MVDDDTVVAEGRSGSRRRLRLRLPRWRSGVGSIPDRWIQRVALRRRLRALAVVLVASIVAVGVWLVWFSPVFAVNDVRVVGLGELSSERGTQQVLSTAAIATSTPLLQVDTAAARDRVAALDWVATAEVYRSWPRAIVVEVTERTPVAVVEEGEVRTGVDASGALFDPPGGVWITDPVIQGDQGAVPEAVEVIASLPPEIERRVRVVQAVSPDDIRLELGNGAIVRWGNAEDGEFKAQVLLALLPRRAQSYDVSAPELPTTFAERSARD